MDLFTEHEMQIRLGEVERQVWGRPVSEGVRELGMKSGCLGLKSGSCFSSRIVPQMGVSARDLQPLRIFIHPPQDRRVPSDHEGPWEWQLPRQSGRRSHHRRGCVPLFLGPAPPPQISHPNDSLSPPEGEAGFFQNLWGLSVAAFSICFCFLNLGFQQTCPQTIASPHETKQVKD